MAGVTQTIDTYFAGVSQQPDLKKFPGQVKDIVNGVPDAIEGLYKRPGAMRIGTDKLPGEVQPKCKWFHYYRDEKEGSYIFQVSNIGRVRVWSCKDGTEKGIFYDKDNETYDGNDGDHTAITDYLTPSTVDGVLQTDDIQAITINDTTFLCNRSKTVSTQGTTAAREHEHFAYIEILRAENGRQYGMNIFNSDTLTTMKRATRLKIHSDTLDQNNETGHCPGIGTQVFSVDNAPAKNLIFRLTVVGQQGRSIGSDDGEGFDEYACTYNKKVTLLHGGEGFETGDTETVTLDQARTSYNYTIRVEDHEEIACKANIKLVRPAPTPFDQDTAVTTDTIIGGIRGQLSGTSPNISNKVIGHGIYLHSDSPFSVEVVDKDLMRVMHEEINDVSDLPTQCRHGYIVKVANSAQSAEDDYYLKFVGNDDRDGPGSWVECPKPGIVKDFTAAHMPHVLQRQADGDFLVRKYSWASREVGDDNTNPMPSFVGNKINKVLFFRNRLAFLSGENVILSQPGELAVPNFFAKTALAISAIDPIDISCSSVFPSDLYDGIETAAGLAVFSTNQQFLLSSDAEIMNPDTAKLRSISTYNYNKDLAPISLGTTIGYVDNSGKYSRFNEMTNIQREAEPLIGETSKIVPSLLPKDLNLLTNSRENQIVLFGKEDSDILYGYKYLTYGDKRQQQAWFKWKLNNPIKYHFIIDDDYFFLDTDNFLQRISLIQKDSDPSIDETVGSDTSNYLIHLDNWSTISNGVYDIPDDETTFTDQSDWVEDVTTPNGDLVIVDIATNSARIGRYAKCAIHNTVHLKVPGDWSQAQDATCAPANVNTGASSINIAEHGFTDGQIIKYSVDSGGTIATGLTNNTEYYIKRLDGDNFNLRTYQGTLEGENINLTGQGSGTHRFKPLNFKIGYIYDYSVHFPTIYLTQAQGDQSKSELNGSLTVHRVKLNFGKSGLYETTLQRTAPKPNYTEIYEAPALDEYNVSDAPYVPENVQTVPVYEKNTNVEIQLKSTHPAPATLHALTWEGDYTPKNYRRV